MRSLLNITGTLYKHTGVQQANTVSENLRTLRIKLNTTQRREMEQRRNEEKTLVEEKKKKKKAITI